MDLVTKAGKFDTEEVGSLHRLVDRAIELRREIEHGPPGCRREKEEELLHLGKRIFLAITGKKAYVSPWRWRPERP